MSGEFSSLVFVDRVRNVRVAALDEDLSSTARSSSRRLPARCGFRGRAHEAAQRASAQDLARARSSSALELVDEVDKVIELDLTRRVDRDGFERFSDLVVGVLARGRRVVRARRECREDGRFWEAPSRVQVNLAARERCEVSSVLKESGAWW